MMRHLRVVLLGLLVGWGAAYAQAAPDTAALTAQLEAVERTLSDERHQDMDALLRQVSTVRAQASGCIDSLNEVLAKIATDQSLLGDAVSGEAAGVAEKREMLRKERREADRQLSACRLLLLRSDELSQQIDVRQKAVLQQTLFAHGPDAWTLLRDNWSQPAIWFDATTRFISSSSGLEHLSPLAYGVLGALAVLALTVAFLLRARLLRWADRQVVEVGFSRRFSMAFLSVFGRYAPQWLVSSVVAAYLYVVTQQISPLPFITQVALGVPFYFLLLTLVYLFLAPTHPQLRLLPIETTLASGLVRRFTVLMLVLLFGYLLFTTLQAQSFPESALLLARSFFSAVLVINLIWIAGLLGHIPQLRRLAWLRKLFVLVMAAALVVEWLGYRNLSAFVMRGVFGSLILLGLLWVTTRLLREFFEGLAAGKQRWAHQARALFGLAVEHKIPALGWLRLFVQATLVVLLLIGLLRVWGVSESGLLMLLTGGFTVGSLTIVPARIALALAILGLLLFLNGWFKARLTSRWLDGMPLERGARETMVTLSGYVGIVIAVLVALGVAGVEFSNLALIAGALSVGIGFGLQNIVNNFVSGLILLFERPVRIGDWVSVGTTEGYVKRISIRSTEIQTFDRAEVIVPNSDLISQQVTNFMLHDPRGRVRVPVGVAYGSDVYQVRDLLLKACSDHPLVITDGSSPVPKVLFRAFGESALDFELRCHITNIDSRMDVISDLNFAINDLFRAHDIEIPFPQRDIHIISDKKSPAPLSEHYRPTAHQVEQPEKDSDE
ncbi:MAG TPA: mechanosensitive ion channel domain-containing protein [Gammaproteobacteria bacterium]